MSAAHESATPEIAAQEIARRLAAYLDAPVARLNVLASGWETNIFDFVLDARSSRYPAIPVGRSIVLRSYQGAAADAKATREHTTIDRLSRAGYQVPHPYLFEPGRDALGVPFLIMERLAGGPLLKTRSFPESFRTFSLGFFAFVRAQARLHRYDPAGAGLHDISKSFAPRSLASAGASSDAPLLDRVLATIAERVEDGPLPGLRGALERVTERAPQFRTEKLSIVHMDYHPLNVMVQNWRLTGVLDWSNADVGDRHLDAATTSMILSSWALERPRWMRDNLVGNGLRASFASLYLPMYHAMTPIDFERFRYCQAVAALQRLSLYGMMRARGPESVGYRRESITEITRPAITALSRYASRKCGARASLEAN